MDILHVDDDSSIREQARIFLEKEVNSFDVDTAHSAKEALTRLDGNGYDIIISDYKMPEMDGLEFLKVVREDRGSDIPFIIFTGKGREEVAMEALNLGADRYLQKRGEAKSQYGVLAQAVIQEVERSRISEEKEKIEAEHSSLVKGSEDPIYIVDEKYEFTFANQAELERHGLKKSELIGSKFRDLHSEGDSRTFEKKVEKVLETANPQSHEAEEAVDGRYFKRTISPIKNPKTGKVERVSVISKDVTELKEHERKLVRSEKRYRRLLETAEVMIVSIDNEGKVTQANRKTSDVLGYDKKNIIGKNWFENFVPKEYRPGVQDVHSEIKEDEYPEYYENPVLTKSGDVRTILWHNSALRNEDGEVIGTLSSGMDITERKDLEEKIRKSRDRLERSQEIAKVGSWEIDLESGDLTWSDEVNRIFGVPIGESLNYDDFLEIVHPEDREYVDENWKEALESGGYDVEHRIVVSGETKWVREKALVEFDEEGEPVEAIGSVQDITERKEAEKEAERMALERREAFDAIEDPIFILDKNHEIMSVNKSALDFLEVSEEEIIGGKCYEFFHDEESPIKNCPLEKSIEAGEAKEEEFYEPIFDKHFLVRTHPIFTDGESPNTFVHQIQDITERVKAEEHKDFLHSLLRHDVRNKIQVIQGYNELVKDFDLPEEAEEYISKGNKGAKEAAEIIDKVRELREAQEEDVRTVELDVTIKEAVDQESALAEEKGFEIDLPSCEGKCEVIAGDLLDRVFSNIIENSVQHSNGSKIHVRVEEDEEDFVCIIEDDGKGIFDEEKEKIFEKGYTENESGGTGLGMFLVGSLVDIYGGEIEVKDSDLGGARFDIHLRKG